MKAPLTRGPTPLPEVSVAEIDRAIERGIYDKTFSAAACVASVGGKIFHRAVYGCAVAPPPLRKIDFTALFDLASLTKPLATGLAALWLVSKGRLDLSLAVAKVLPAFNQACFAAMTLDMLLDHTSGLPASPDLYGRLAAAEAKSPPSSARVRGADPLAVPSARVVGTAQAVPAAQRLVAQLGCEQVPGSAVRYSDVGFLVLGWVIEAVVGKPLDLFLEQEIYRPLGVDRDLFFVRHDAPARAGGAPGGVARGKRLYVATEQCGKRGRLLQGEVHDPNAWALGGVAGHAGLFGTADAVWRVAESLRLSWRGVPGAFFHPATVVRFWTRSQRVAQTTRTLGWDMPVADGSACGKRFSRTSVGHLGFTGTSLWIDLSNDVVGVLLTNAAHPSPEGKQPLMAKLRPRVYDLIAGAGDHAADRHR